MSPTPERAAALTRRIKLIVMFTITYNIAEAIVSIWAGRYASSGALIGFGIDSSIEVASALAVAWQFSRRDPKKYEPLTLQFIAFSFFGLATYVIADSVFTLIWQQPPEVSLFGIAIAAVSVVIMPMVSYVERRAGLELGSATAVADSKQTLVCAWLSVALLVGLALHAIAGWWWADPVAALVIAGFALREGKEAWEGDACALSTGRVLDPNTELNSGARPCGCD